MEKTTRLEYYETDSFKRDLKKLLKRFKTLESDLQVVKRDAIELFHLKKIDNQSIFPIHGFCTNKILICKIKKFACKALKGRGAKSGIRVIYAFYADALKVEFIEIYFKADQKNEDRERIKEYLKSR
ncbi:MAG: hypothetical protein HZA77_06565 [Candidatus Schekmanbacteria bacterium]|nr:hypothetical protein [Candidatus Schekmanbacteria bacterium]